MRIRDIILEDPQIEFEAIEDEAETRGDSALLTALEWLRHEAEQSNAVTPRVAVDTVIDRVRNIPGNEAFNFAALDAAYKSNEAIKGLIKNIKDDEHTGTKYVYLAPPENTIDDTDPLGAGSAPKGDPSKIVSKMASRAATK
ncbi:hypothetical protein UFOVP190_225 [uncultured Caudovirales phage]|uniref:Uncharacterized protein n=1 Tax=uncultured Caudovirales phage TaxID=2100421 RepID=A0A6J7WKL8_9CAUD|nr:hypothetical protein UFOVP190_225 [uncultured Caudovirales phage]